MGNLFRLNLGFTVYAIQYCAKVMQTNFNEIPGFSGLFEEISLDTIF